MQAALKLVNEPKKITWNLKGRKERKALPLFGI